MIGDEERRDRGRHCDREHNTDRPSGPPGKQHGEQPDDEVELLLDRQAPEVQHCGRPAEQVGVRRLLGQEVPVGDVEAAGNDVRPCRRLQIGGDDPADSDDGQRDERRGKQPPRPSPPETSASENRPVVTISLRIIVPINTPDRVKNSDTPR